MKRIELQMAAEFHKTPKSVLAGYLRCLVLEYDKPVSERRIVVPYMPDGDGRRMSKDYVRHSKEGASLDGILNALRPYVRLAEMHGIFGYYVLKSVPDKQDKFVLEEIGIWTDDHCDYIHATEFFSGVVTSLDAHYIDNMAEMLGQNSTEVNVKIMADFSQRVNGLMMRLLGKPQLKKMIDASKAVTMRMTYPENGGTDEAGEVSVSMPSRPEDAGLVDFFTQMGEILRAEKNRAGKKPDADIQGEASTLAVKDTSGMVH